MEISFIACVFGLKEQKSDDAGLAGLAGECFPSSSALPFLWLASCGYCSHLDSLAASPHTTVSLGEGTPWLSLSSLSIPAWTSSTPFHSPCWSFLLCAAHSRPHFSLGNVDLFLTSSSQTGKEARPLEIVRNLLPRNAWEWSGWKEEGVLIVFLPSFFSAGIGQWKNAVIVHLFILCKSGAKDLCWKAHGRVDRMKCVHEISPRLSPHRVGLHVNCVCETFKNRPLSDPYW